MSKIFLDNAKINVYGFTYEAYKPTLGSPATFVGRNICSLTQTEKQSYLIDKLLSHIRCPSVKEVEKLNNTFDVFVQDGACRLLLKGQIDPKIKFANIGTTRTPAIFYDKFIFVLDRRKKVFAPVELSVVFFNTAYALMIIGDDLLIKFDVKGIKALGNFNSVQKVPWGYLINAKSEEESLFFASSACGKLFDLTDTSSYSVDSRTGTVAHDYTDLSTIPAGHVVDIYINQKGSYVLVNILEEN